MRTDIGLIKFRKEEKQIDYLDKYNELINQFKNDSFLYFFLKEITLVSHDFTDKINSNNFKVNIMTNMNNKYIYPAIVSINSVLKNSNKKNITIVYHILYPEDLRRGNINKVKSLLYNYPNNLELIFYNMGNLFSTFKRTRFSEVTFFRLLAPLFIPEERIIYLDSDVLAFEDLSEMYQLDMNDNYIYGFLDLLSNGIDYLGLKSDKYVNAGVLLINLDLIRKNKKYKELLSMKIYNKKLNNNDQTIINYIFYPNIGILPSKYGIFNFESIFDIKYIYLKSIRQNLNIDELIRAFNHPALMHYVLCDPKIWNSESFFIKKYTRIATINKSSCSKYHDIWIEYARNTSFFEEIIKYYKIKNKSI